MCSSLFCGIVCGAVVWCPLAYIGASWIDFLRSFSSGLHHFIINRRVRSVAPIVPSLTRADQKDRKNNSAEPVGNVGNVHPKIFVCRQRREIHPPGVCMCGVHFHAGL